MAISVEAILSDARKLVLRLKEHDNSADCLIIRMQSLQKQLEAMKQFQECLNELNEVARHRPRLGLIITLAQENSKIRELQSENLELRQSLSDHQSALEVIMTKYREQLANLTRANQVERSLLQRSASRQEDVEQKSEKISEMTAVMWQAAKMEDRSDTVHDVIAQLQRENHAMRELLQLELLDSTSEQTEAETPKTPSSDAAIQTHPSPDHDPFCTGDFATIRPRPLSCRTPPSTKTISASNDSQHSSYVQNPDQDDFSKHPPSSVLPENLADVSSSSIESTNDVNSSSAVPDVESTPCTDEDVSVNSSESLETLVNPDELAADDEYI